MNNIYKVIWSKAKNCYVVASEIARSHTKSATGSEKIGGVTRRSLLASLMALSLLCGGLGVAEATVHVNEGTGVTHEVYTTGETYSMEVADAKLDLKADKTDVATNTANIATNADKITKLENDKLDKTLASETYATKDTLNALKDTVNGKADKDAVTTALGDKADKADVYSKTGADDKFATKDALNNKADTTYVDNAVAGAVTTAGTNVDTKLADYAKTADVDTKLAGKANKTDLENATNRITTNEGNITALQNKTAKLSADGTELTGMTTVSGTTVSGTNVEAGALKVTGEISNGAGVTTTLADIKDSMDRTDMNKTWIGKLNAKTTNISHDATGTSVDGVTFNAGAVTGVTSINGTKIGVQESGEYIHQDNSIWGNMKKVDTQVKTNADAIAQEKTDREKAIGSLTENKNYIKKGMNVSDNLVELDKQAKTNADNIQTNANNIKINKDEIARVNGELVKTNDYFNAELGKTNDYFNKELGKTNNHFNTELEKTNAALQATNKRTAGIDRIDATSETTIEKNVKVDNRGNVTAKGNVTADGKLTGKGVDAGDGAITTKGAVNAGSLNVTDASHLKGDVTMDNTLKVTGDTSLKKTDVDGALNAKDNVILGTNAANTVTVNGKSDSKAAVEMDKGLTVTNGDTSLKKTDVNGALSVTGESSLKNTTVGGTLDVTGATTLKGTLTAEKDATFEKNVTVQKDLTVDGKLNVDKISMKNDELKNGKKHDSATTITADEISNLAKVTEQGNTTESQFTHNEKGTFNYAKDEKSTGEWKRATSNVTADGVSNKMTDSDGNTHTYYQTATESKEQLVNGNKSNFEKKTAEGNTISIKDKDADGNKKSLTNKQTVDGEKTSVTNKDSSSTVNQGADQIRNYVASTDGTKSSTEVKADGITNTSDGTITNDAKDIVNNASGNISNKSQTMDTTVTGKATESYGSLDTTVNGNETHIVKGTKAETVDGKVTENYKAGQATNVTGNQDIKVSGTQTTTATDIKRNASGGMIDTIDNDYGTNTETKVAGKTTTDVSIKGTGEKGQYIRGANESRDYLIKGTLKNSETKTVDATSTEITDGTNKASTIQKVTDLAGSVTNGKETGVSGIHANKDGSVSIDSAVAGGGMSSVINQKKDSIQSAVGDGTNSTVILQDKDNVTIASSNGMVGLVGKDIVNNAQDTITNTAGTSITNQVNDSKVTTDANGTTFENNTPAVSDGGATTTKINGNQITTGRVDANELGVSDKDGTNTADLSVKAGEGVKASASDGTTTGSLDVTADEVGSTVKDASGKGSTFKQRIDAIMMESKNVSIKAEETLTNEAKVITNKASEVINNEAVNINNTATGIITSKASEIKNQADKLISNKVGENTWENMENGKITTSIKDGAKQNLTQSDAAGTTQSTVGGGKSTVTIQNADGLVDAVTDGTNTSVQNQTASAIAAAVKDGAGNENASVANATTSVNTIKSGSKANTVISTADGTSFINSEAAAPVGDGTEVKTTIKGNTITTGKVTMDYAEVMKDIGVRGNANIAGKTTTGSLEVKGESKLTGDVTMESNATVKKDLTVEGNTNLKNTKVDGTLDVAQKATFGDSVSIAKDLSVDGNATIKGDVTAKSYKVGDKTYISAAGINANDQKITNVADGSISEGSKDAVNGGQLYTVKNDLEGKVNKVGANAAAMANLHPMEFDPDSKWNVAAAIGNYGSETAAALGAFYRPNDDVMVNLSTAFGTGENMVGGGVSVRLGKGGNKLSREETNALKAQVADLTARMDALLSVLNPNMSKDFPDVPENHWAYEAVSRLAGNDIVQGYPDGEFHGERTMTRYEMAEIIYNALSRGAEAEKELVEEFKPELQAMAASEKATAEKAEG